MEAVLQRSTAFLGVLRDSDLMVVIRVKRVGARSSS